jgi:hypothetical protein
MQIYTERERHDFVPNEAGHGTILGELAVLACILQSSSGEREVSGPALERLGLSQPSPPRSILFGTHLPQIAPNPCRERAVVD